MKLTPRQKAQLRRPRPFLFLAILSVFGLPWLLLFKTGIQARRQSAEMDKAATAFLAQFPSQSQNSAARQFDRLAADLGFTPNSNADDLLRVDIEAEQDYRKIEASLNGYLTTQFANPSGALSPLPIQLKDYLLLHESSLVALQSHLLASTPPIWDVDLVRMTEITASSPGFINVLNVQKLLLLLAIDCAYYGRTDQMLQAMEASWRLNEALSERPDLIAQLLVSFTAEQQAGLLRHVEMSSVWQETWQKRLSDRNFITRPVESTLSKVPPGQLAQRSAGRSVVGGLQFNAWLQYRTLQRSLLSQTTRRSSSRLLSALSYWFSPVYYFSLRNIDTHSVSQRAIGTLKTLNVCQTTRLEAKQQLSLEKTAVWNSNHLPVETLVRRWKDAGERSLSLELTQKILLAKQLAQTNGQWPATLPALESDICPGEYWIYQRAENGAIAFSFSAQIDPQTVVPLFYRSAESFEEDFR